MTASEISDYLITALNEVPATRALFFKIASRLGAQGTWELLQVRVKHHACAL
jgi:hypothetical protein